MLLAEVDRAGRQHDAKPCAGENHDSCPRHDATAAIRSTDVSVGRRTTTSCASIATPSSEGRPSTIRGTKGGASSFFGSGIRAALRVRAEPEPFLLGDLAIQYQRRRMTVAGRWVRLTAIEFEMLKLLSMNAGRPVTYEIALRRVWEGRDSGDPGAVRAFVKKLRIKLDDDATKPMWIFTERGIGYSMPRPEEVQEAS